MTALERTGYRAHRLRGDDESYSVERFLSLTLCEIEHEAERRRTSPTGTTWLSLGTLMRRRGYGIVVELGEPAAVAWGTHLGVLTVRSPATDSGRPAH
jgi:hypothetical protein